MRKVEKTCMQCGGAFISTGGGAKYCSPKCAIRSGIRIDESGCWIWTRRKNRAGYGVVGQKHGNPVSAHRVSWEAFSGASAEGLNICHRCDVRACVNPDHLFLGTQRDNIVDMHNKGRGYGGAKHHNAKLSEEQVRAIRKDSRSQSQIAGDYGIPQSHVSKIRTRKKWKHLKD